MSSSWWQKKLQGGSIQQAMAPAPMQPTREFRPAPPEVPNEQRFGTDRNGVQEFMSTVTAQGRNAWGALASQWSGGAGMRESNQLGSCPECGSPRFSANGNKVFSERHGLVSPSAQCFDCGFNEANRIQYWDTPRQGDG